MVSAGSQWTSVTTLNGVLFIPLLGGGPPAQLLVLRKFAVRRQSRVHVLKQASTNRQPLKSAAIACVASFLHLMAVALASHDALGTVPSCN